MAATDAKRIPEASPSIFGWPVSVLPWWARILGLLAAAGIVAGAAMLASAHYPNAATRGVSGIEQVLADVFHDPTVESWDGAIVGDLLVERFYILDLVSGDRYVSDFLKGRVEGVEIVHRQDQSPAHVFILNAKDMRKEKAFFAAYLKAVSSPGEAMQASYLGLVTPTGERDAFPVNYNGEVPTARFAFVAANAADVYGYMLTQNYKDVTAPRGISMGGFTYVLSSTEVFPLFKNEFRLDKTLFISELLLIDTTSRPNKTTYFKLLEQFPKAAGQ